MYAHRIIHQHRLDVWVWIHLAVCLWCVKPLGTMTHEEKSQTVPKFDNNFKAQCVLFVSFSSIWLVDFVHRNVFRMKNKKKKRKDYTHERARNKKKSRMFGKPL